MAGSQQSAIGMEPTGGAEPWLKQVAVVIPCRNETHTILEVVAALPPGIGQWLVVDNGSSPQCQALLHREIPTGNLLQTTEALGVGGAFLAGCRNLDPGIDWICKLDGDGQFCDVDLTQLFRIAVSSDAALVKTARCNQHGWGVEPERSGSRHWGNQLLTLLLAIGSGYYLLEDGTSGLFLIRRQALEVASILGGLRLDHGFETSLLLNLGGVGADVVELRVPVRYWEQRGRTFSGRALAFPLAWCLIRGGWRRLLRTHLLYRLSPGGILLAAASVLVMLGFGLGIYASIKALSAGAPTTPGISAAATSLLSWGLIAALGFLAYDFASTFRRFCCKTAFGCWKPIATQGIQATRAHQAKRPS